MPQIVVVTLPDIGEGVVEGEVIAWLKKVGDPVAKDEPVVTVMTDKATVELPAPVAGHLEAIFYTAGSIARVGLPLYSLASESKIITPESPSLTPTPASMPSVAPVASPQTSVATDSSPIPLATSIAAAEDITQALPSTRHLARTLGIDLTTLTGSGKSGRILVQDLLSSSTSIPVTKSSPKCNQEVAAEEGVPLIGIRRAMCQKMTLAKRTIPHFSYFESVDVSRLIQLRQKIALQADQEHIHLTYMPFFLRALSLTIQEYPQINSSVDGDKLRLYQHPHHNIGIAMASNEGLIVPVLKKIEKDPLAELIHRYEVLKKTARQGTLTLEEMRGSTITISNFGVFGSEGTWATPIIQPPEVAIVALAKITSQPVVQHGEVTIRPMLNLSWSFDHRLIDGQLAAAVSHHFAQLLLNPACLL